MTLWPLCSLVFVIRESSHVDADWVVCLLFSLAFYQDPKK